MNVRTFVFQEQLIMSDGCISEQGDTIEGYLLKAIPFAKKVERANRADDRKGIDWWVTLQSGRITGVDVKVRDKDYGKDDLALETWSVIEKKVIGWTRNPDKQTDYILWIWKDTKRCVLLPFPWLCSIFIDHWEAWRKKYKPYSQNTENRYHSECVFVPRTVVWGAIYSTYGGKPERRLEA